MATKVLQAQQHNLYYQLPDSNEQHLITDISEEDVLRIVEAILQDPSSVLMDDLPDDKSQINPASVVIFEELKAQFDALIAKKPTLDARLDANFTEAEQYYKDADPKDDLIE